ncbi:PREDICTED: uncharacterized protein LOC109475129 [Branchiostoma belcheri]|uniref:Uncharacterized protein LOC109475129 n=1 Tax=Branchiostoma belcheri TaxID=7741 RepID=A0A6P4YP25_BRABE|nr:PREDICTED: uncharacterized protein LOC109475129 [Branchiostoma belcheri]
MTIVVALTMTIVSVVLVALVVLISIAIIVHSAIGCVSGNCVCCTNSRNHNMVLEITPQAETFEFTSEILTQISVQSALRPQDVEHLRAPAEELPGQMQQQQDTDARKLEKYQVDNIC